LLTGIAHILASAPDAATVPFGHLAAAHALAAGVALRLDAARDRPATYRELAPARRPGR